MKSNWKEYSTKLPFSKRIYEKLYGEPKSHKEWAERFNIIGSINEILLNGQRDI